MAYLFWFSSRRSLCAIISNRLVPATMKEETLTLHYKTYSYDELPALDRQLIDRAKSACSSSYAPYSHFHVGAAVLLENGEIINGSNQENAAYPSGICAERCTIFYANSRYPESAVLALAIAASTAPGEFLSSPITPCGACRQVLLETQRRFNSPMRILLYGTSQVLVFNSIDTLLPFQFTGAEIQP